MPQESTKILNAVATRSALPLEWAFVLSESE